MSANHTANYGLSQWEGEDRVLRTDFNEDNAKLDAALAAHDAVLARKGNGQLWTTSYYGTGSAPSINFPKRPSIVFVIAPNGFMVMLPGMAKATSVFPNATHNVNTTWNGNSVSWYGGEAWVMMAASGTSCQVVAILPA